MRPRRYAEDYVFELTASLQMHSASMRPRRYAEDYMKKFGGMRQVAGFNEASALCRGLRRTFAERIARLDDASMRPRRYAEDYIAAKSMGTFSTSLQ